MKSLLEYLIESSQLDRSAGIKNQASRSKDQERGVAMSDSAFHFRFKYKGWLFKPTFHASSQAFDRRPDLDKEDWKKMHKNVLDKLEKMKKLDGEFIFFSKSLQQAYVAAVEFNKKVVRIITVLPKGRSNPKPGTIRMIIEGIEYDLEWVEIG